MNIKKLFTVGGVTNVTDPRVICKPGQYVKDDQTTIAHAQVKVGKHVLHVTSESQALVKLAQKKKTPEIKNSTLRKIVAKLTSLATGFSYDDTGSATCAVIPVAALRHALDAMDGDMACISLSGFSGDSAKATDYSAVTIIDMQDRKTIVSIVAERVRMIGGVPVDWHLASIAGKSFWRSVSGVYMKRDLAEAHIRHENRIVKKSPLMAKAFGIKHVALSDEDEEDVLPVAVRASKPIAKKKSVKVPLNKKKLEEDVRAAVGSAGGDTKKQSIKRKLIGRKPIKKKAVKHG